MSAACKPCVLLVDDHVQVLRVTARMIQRLGYAVVAVETGAAAIEAFRDQPEQISVVMLDLQLPDMSGAEVLVELRRMRPDVRVIITSGDLGRPNMAESIESADAALGKPFSLASVREILARLTA